VALKQGVQGGLVWWLNYLDDGEEGCSGLVSGENVGTNCGDGSRSFSGSRQKMSSFAERREQGIIVLSRLLPQPPSVIESFSLRAVEVDRGLYSSSIGVIICNSPRTALAELFRRWEEGMSVVG